MYCDEITFYSNIKLELRETEEKKTSHFHHFLQYRTYWQQLDLIIQLALSVETMHPNLKGNVKAKMSLWCW